MNYEGFCCRHDSGDRFCDCPYCLWLLTYEGTVNPVPFYYEGDKGK